MRDINIYFNTYFETLGTLFIGAYIYTQIFIFLI